MINENLLQEDAPEIGVILEIQKKWIFQLGHSEQIICTMKNPCGCPKVDLIK